MGARPLRYLSSPRPVRVAAGPSGVPCAVITDGRRRGVVDVRDEWLVQDRWWTDHPVDRHFFELVLDPGRVMTVYRDTRTGEWFGY